ncbi:MAG: hypothetical protein LC746_18825, partial [Acidobacteria bacterium]|nr:hypothetical protein [Acidobacteriota bacterium]
MRKVVTAAEMRELDRLTTERYAVPSPLLMEAAASAAARFLSSHFPQGLSGLRALVLCGRGNNGGDGAALARILWESGAARVEVLLFGRVEEARGDARANFEIVSRLAGSHGDATDAVRHGAHGGADDNASRDACEQPRLSFVECADADECARRLEAEPRPHVVVDALFGTGLTRPLEGVFAELISQLSALRARSALRGAPQQRPGESKQPGDEPQPFILSLDLPSGLDA